MFPSSTILSQNDNFEKYTNTFILSKATPTSSQTLYELPQHPSLQNLDPSRKRRLHHKSRTGCENCRRRRVKCNEDENPCTNCTRRHENCHQRLSIPIPQTSKPIATLLHAQLPLPISLQLNLTHLHLFHHFQTITQKTLLLPPSFWTETISLSLRAPYLTHTLLSLSSLHLSYLNPKVPTHLVNTSLHLSHALNLFNTALSQTNPPLIIDTFIATTVLLQYIVWAYPFIPFPSSTTTSNSSSPPPPASPQTKSQPLTPSITDLFTLSTTLKLVFRHFLPTLLLSQTSLLLPYLASNPYETVLQTSSPDPTTTQKYLSLFTSTQPLQPSHLETITPSSPPNTNANRNLNPTLPAIESTQSKDIYNENPHLKPLLLILSFLPTANSHSQSQEKEIPESLPYLIHHFPIISLLTPISVFSTQTLLHLYHFYRAIRILLFSDLRPSANQNAKYWWCHKRTLLSEEVLRGWLIKECVKERERERGSILRKGKDYYNDQGFQTRNNI